MTASDFLARMSKMTAPQGAPSNAALAPVAAQAPAAAPANAPLHTGGFLIPNTVTAPAVAPPFSGGVVGMPSGAHVPPQPAEVPSTTRTAPAAPFQINPPENALPPPPPTGAEPPPPPAATTEALPEAAGKGARKKKDKGGGAATPSVSDDYLEHHARQCAALQGAFANPNLCAMDPASFAAYVVARLDAFEALTGAK